MRSGDLTSAMRASMSVPGAVAPVDARRPQARRRRARGQRPDPGGARPLRGRGRHRGERGLAAHEARGGDGRSFSVVGQMVNLLTEQNVVALARAPQPHATSTCVRSWATSRRPTSTGSSRPPRSAARPRSPWPTRCARYRSRPRKYQAWPRPPAPAARPFREVDEVRDRPDALRESRDLRGGLAPEGRRAARHRRRSTKDLVRSAAPGDLQTLDYSVVNERDKTILRVTPVEKALGPRLPAIRHEPLLGLPRRFELQHPRAPSQDLDQPPGRRNRLGRAGRHHADAVRGVLPAPGAYAGVVHAHLWGRKRQQCPIVLRRRASSPRTARTRPRRRSRRA